MIRVYRTADCERVVEVWERATALAHPFLSQEFVEQERTAIRQSYLPVAETWVWEDDGQIFGFISLLENEIGAIFVDPTFGRRGVGRALVDTARALRGELEVEVFEKNLIGRAFYNKLGFEFRDRRIHEPTGFVLWRLDLSAPAPDQVLAT